jgi:hypothetical protein
VDAFIGALKDTPLPTILVVAGITFWVLALAGSVAGKITIQPGRQWAAGIGGTILIALGLWLYIAPTKQPPTKQPSPPTTTNSNDSNQPFVDSVKIRTIGPRPDAPLRQPTDIHLDLDYSLFSADRAILTVYLEQFPQTATGCSGTEHHTNGGIDLRVARGEHIISVAVHWPGASGTGFLAVGASFWRDVDGQPVGPSTQLGLFSDICYTYRP